MCTGAKECGEPSGCLLINVCLGRGKKWSQHPGYLGDAGNWGLANRMAHSGGGKGHGAKFTGGQASLLVLQDKRTLWSSWEKDCTPHWESLVGSLTSSWEPVLGERMMSWCVWEGGCAAADCGEVWAPMKWWVRQLPQYPPLGYLAPF